MAKMFSLLFSPVVAFIAAVQRGLVTATEDSNTCLFRANHTTSWRSTEEASLNAHVVLFDDNYHPIFRDVFFGGDGHNKVGGRRGAGGLTISPTTAKDFVDRLIQRTLQDRSTNGAVADLLQKTNSTNQSRLSRQQRNQRQHLQAFRVARLARRTREIDQVRSSENQNESGEELLSARSGSSSRLKKQQQLVSGTLQRLLASNSYSRVGYDDKVLLVRTLLGGITGLFSQQREVQHQSADAASPIEPVKIADGEQLYSTGASAELLPPANKEPLDPTTTNSESPTASRKRRRWSLLHVPDVHLNMPLTDRDRPFNVRMDNAFRNARNVHLRKRAPDDVLGINADYSGVQQQQVNSEHQVQPKVSTSNPRETFEALLDLYEREKADLLLLGGDLFNFPQDSAVQWVLEQLERRQVRFLFTAGNHDWMTEGKPQEPRELQIRTSWEGVLKPMLHMANRQSHEPFQRPVELVELGGSGEDAELLGQLGLAGTAFPAQFRSPSFGAQYSHCPRDALWHTLAVTSIFQVRFVRRSTLRLGRRYGLAGRKT
ncbi:unnamed protein product [Amoebophrya sp. A25]|nr:unnamed protein product [Amoebophrya sp. A25]|eukprot:GSA25T00008513001.1